MYLSVRSISLVFLLVTYCGNKSFFNIAQVLSFTPIVVVTPFKTNRNNNSIMPLPMLMTTTITNNNRSRINTRRRTMIGNDISFQPSSSSLFFPLTSSKDITTQLYCSAINPENMDIDGSTSINKEITIPTTKTWKEKLLRFSTIASILCVIDCTILPIITMILPLLGMVSAMNQILPYNHLLHYYGHQMTMYFVLPIGFFATTTNYIYNHQKKWITAIGWFGLFLILMANSGSGCATTASVIHTHAHTHAHTAKAAVTVALPSFLNTISIFVSSVLHTIQHGIYHRITNLTGCAFLIMSNYISHQYQQKNHKHHNHNHNGKDCCSTN